MLREVRLYGEMGRRFGRVHQFDIATPAEALRALRANCGRPFQRYLFEMRDAPFHVLVNDEPADMHAMARMSGPGPIRIIPVIAGGKSDVLMIVAGVALLILAGPVGGAIGAAIGFGGATITGVISAVGLSLVLTGVSGLLFRPPDLKQKESPENTPSYSFDGAVNTAGQGNPVPVGYGRMRVGSQVFSMGLFVEDM
jgi:predicted phage tail protein